MTNKERIQVNNEGLRSCIELAESLPDVDDSFDAYDGAYTVTPKVNAQTLPTAKKIMLENVQIHAIPIYEVSNQADGETVYIGTEVNINGD